MLNRELFQRDPTTFTIPNDGVTTVKFPETPEQWDVLHYELQSFVCEGQYRLGLERILTTYLNNLTKSKQPAVWVSGFYGSGKSHLVRVLEHYWRNLSFPDGTEARNLSNLPMEIDDLLRELSTAGKQGGGLWAAAGRMSGGADSIRLDILRILFESAGLPSEYAPARFVLWMQRKGYYEQVAAAVADAGEDLHSELREMYVSPLIGNSLLQAFPDLANNQKEAREYLKAQFPDKEEISNTELVTTVREVLELQSTKAGELPCTLLIFDEIQQVIGSDTDRALEVQSIVEDLCSTFGTRLLVIGTGQSAIQATPQLQKLQGRFTVRVELSDRDVEHVVREVVLRKDPTKVPQLKSVLENNSGEIDRQLAGTKIAANSADNSNLAPDYPLLPARRRFWERLARAIDTGTTAQLRTQLRMVHEAARAVANEPLGTVVGGDFIYEQQKSAMLQSDVLLADLAAIIDEQNDGTDEGALRSRLCATIFLIGRLPTTGALATGLRANATSLADLLVQDLNQGSVGLRQQVPKLLDGLVENGTLMLVQGEYRLQTRESAEWERDYRQRSASIKSDTTRIASDRAAALKQAVGKALKGIKLLQGVNQAPRKIDLHFGLEQPSTKTTAVPIWIRDEWSVSGKAVRQDAQAVGTDSPLVFVLLPKLQSDALNNALAGAAAAAATINERPSTQTTSEGMEARKSMATRQELEQAKVEEIVNSVIKDAQVYQGGGNEVVGTTPAESVDQAARNALIRLFPEFSVTDVPGWNQVVKRAGQGNADALEAVQYQGDADKHPAARVILDEISASGTKGTAVREKFTGVGYGWPQDAVDGILLTLLNADFLSAKDKRAQPVTAKKIPQSQIGVTTFRLEAHRLTALQKIGLRKLAADLGAPVQSGDEAAGIQRALQRLLDLAQAISGPQPLPAVPDTSFIENLQNLSGNEQLVQVHASGSELRERYNSWSMLQKRREGRLERWRLLEQLTKHADSLLAAAEVKPQMAAIEQQRTLLEDIDPVKPLLENISRALRTTVQVKRQTAEKKRQQELGAIAETDEWQNLPDDQWQKIFQAHHLGPLDALDIGSDEKLLSALNSRPIAAWETELEAIPTRIRQAREEAAKRLAPTAVRVVPPSTTLETEAEVEVYLADLREKILQHINAGKPVIL